MKKIERLDRSAKKSTGKVFDVMRPGRAPANATSKPVIVGPQVQDPSVSINGIGDRRIPAAQAPGGSRKIEVLSGMRSRPIEVPNEPDPAIDTPNSSKLKLGQAENVPEQEVEALAEVAIDGANHGEKAWEADPADSLTGPLPELPADALMSSTAAPDLSGQGIVVSNHTAAHKGSAVKTVLLALVAILLAVVIIDLLLDAGVITADAIPHTNFFTVE